MERKLKYISLAAAAVITIGASTSAFAGNVNTSNSTTFTPYQVASELANYTNVSISNAKIYYEPTQLPLSSLGGQNAVVNFTLGNNATFVNSASTFILCNNSSTSVGSGVLLNSSTISITMGPNTSIVNGQWYNLNTSSCTNNSPTVGIFVPQGSTGVTLTVNAGSTANQTVYDTASATFVQVLQEYTAKVTNPFNATIDPSTGFMTFYPANSSTKATTSVFSIVDNLNSSNFSSAKSNASSLVVTLTPSQTAGLATADMINNSYIVNSTLNSSNVYVFKTTTTTGAFIPTAPNSTTNSNSTTNPSITVAVNGTTLLQPNSFTLSAVLSFSNGASDQLLNNVPFGQWQYAGTNVYLPMAYVSPDGSANTYIVLQSQNKTVGSSNAVTAFVLTESGQVVSVPLGSITPGTPMSINAFTQLAQAPAVVQAGGVGNQFAVTLNIVGATGGAGYYGYANIVTADGKWERVPLSIESGVSN